MIDPRLAVRLERLEKARREVLSRLSGIDESTLNRCPADDAWSVIQVLHHVILVEELSIGYIERKRTDTTAGRAGLKERVRSWMLRVAMRSPLRFDAPSVSTDLPARDSLDDVASRWEEVRTRIRRTLEEIPADAVDRAIYRHPVIGVMSLDQAVRFLEDHLAHHERQIDRTLGAVEAAS